MGRYVNIQQSNIDKNNELFKKASYAMLSYNTSSTWQGAVFYDDNFDPIINGNRSNFNIGIPTQWIINTTHDRSPIIFSGVTQTRISTNASQYVQATFNTGEFGNDSVKVHENGLLSKACSLNSGNMQYIPNKTFINSNHINKNIVYFLYQGKISSGYRLNPYPNIQIDNNYNEVSLTPYMNSNITNMWGSASYNNYREEIVFIVQDSSAQSRFFIYVYKNVNLNSVNGLNSLKRLPDYTQTITLNTVGTWVNNTESNTMIKPILCDNGDIYITNMLSSSRYMLYKLTYNITNYSLSLIDNLTLTTSYGFEQGQFYGQRIMQSRDQRMVLCWCPYYYYGAGISSFIIDKRNSSWRRGLYMANSSDGILPMPYKDSGFTYYYAGNSYATNPNGGYITTFIYPNNNMNESPVLYNTQLYLSSFTGPNTTNYPGFSHVIEYPFQRSS